MRRSGSKFIAAATVTAAAAVILNLFALQQLRIIYTPFAVQRARWFDLAGQAHEFLVYIGRWRGLTEENHDLKQRLERERNDRAALESLKNENDALRKALDLKAQFGRMSIPAGLFNISLTTEGYAALINKGANDGITSGAAVVTPEGTLVGVIAETFTGSARVMLVSDPSFKATIQVMTSSTSGIARGVGRNGLRIDLIVQSDSVAEGDVLATTGDDRIPAGLVVAVVDHVERNDTELFQNVSARPAATFASGRVMVINP